MRARFGAYVLRVYSPPARPGCISLGLRKPDRCAMGGTCAFLLAPQFFKCATTCTCPFVIFFKGRPISSCRAKVARGLELGSRPAPTPRQAARIRLRSARLRGLKPFRNPPGNPALCNQHANVPSR